MKFFTLLFLKNITNHKAKKNQDKITKTKEEMDKAIYKYSHYNANTWFKEYYKL